MIPSNFVRPDGSGWHVLLLQTAVGEALSSLALEMSAAYPSSRLGNWTG